MTIEFDPLETLHSELDASFRRHGFQVLRKGEERPWGDEVSYE